MKKTFLFVLALTLCAHADDSQLESIVRKYNKDHSLENLTEDELKYLNDENKQDSLVGEAFSAPEDNVKYNIDNRDLPIGYYLPMNEPQPLPDSIYLPKIMSSDENYMERHNTKHLNNIASFEFGTDTPDFPQNNQDPTYYESSNQMENLSKRNKEGNALAEQEFGSDTPAFPNLYA